MERVGRALVVDDDEMFADTLSTFAGGRAATVCRASTAAEAIGILRESRVDVLLLDICLPDGSGISVLDAAAGQPVFPRVIAISGCADPETAFRLAQAGVRCFISKPLDLRKLQQAWDTALRASPDLRPLIRACVGQRQLHELEEQVRRQMTDEALAAGGGSRRKASALLGISRQLLQNILRTRE